MNCIAYIREMLGSRNDYIEIKTPTMMTRELWERSGHWSQLQGKHVHLPNRGSGICHQADELPRGACCITNPCIHSYRELPLRVAEIGNVHRFEPSGSLSGLFRVRSFHQDDAHIFMKPDRHPKRNLEDPESGR